MRRIYSLQIIVMLMPALSIMFTACGGGGESTPPGVNAMPSVAAKVYSSVSASICPTGGIQVDAGIDDNGNSILDPSEVDSTQYVCNGANGLSTLVSIVTEPSGSNCPSGGKKVNVGLDSNLNSLLDNNEITSSDYVCNGVNGTNGFNSLMMITNEPAGSLCQQGGTKIQSGLDINNNALLDSPEVTATTYICGDEQAPSIPTLTATAVSTTQIDLSWTVSSDNVAVVAYDIWRGNIKIATLNNNSYSDTGLTSATTYTYTVDAYDSSGNISAKSAPASAMTFDTTNPSACPLGSYPTNTTDSITGPGDITFTGASFFGSPYAGGTLYLPPIQLLVTDSTGAPRNNVCLFAYTGDTVASPGPYWYTDATFSTYLTGTGPFNERVIVTNDTGVARVFWSTAVLPVAYSVVSTITGSTTTYTAGKDQTGTSFIHVYSGSKEATFNVNWTVQGEPAP